MKLLAIGLSKAPYFREHVLSLTLQCPPENVALPFVAVADGVAAGEVRVLQPERRRDEG